MSEHINIIAVSEAWGSQFGPKFQVEGLGTSHQPFYVSKTRMIDLSYGIRMSAELSFVLSQYMRVTDRQTDGWLCDRKDHVAYNAEG